MTFQSWSASVRETAVELLRVAAAEGKSKTQACRAVLEEFEEPRPSESTLMRWAEREGIYPPPRHTPKKNKSKNNPHSIPARSPVAVDDITVDDIPDTEHAEGEVEYVDLDAYAAEVRAPLLTEISQLRWNLAHVQRERDKLAEVVAFYIGHTGGPTTPPQ